MFAYCNDNPVNGVDRAGSKSIAVFLLNHWLKGDGEDLSFDEDSFVSSEIKNSNIFKEEIEARIADFKNGGPSKLSSKELIFTSAEKDLWLGIRRANYDIEIEEETKTFTFLGLRFTKTHYVATIRVYDIYNFNRGDESGDSIGSVLNNIGYSAQEIGMGTEYSWEAFITYETKWDWYGR